MVFPVVMYGCESWTKKKSEHRRIDAFELWCWRRLLRVPWTARRSNWSILKEISPKYSFEGLMLKMKFQYFGHLMQRTNSLEKTLMLGKIEGRRRRGWQRMRWLDGITDSIDMGLSQLRVLVIDREAWHAAIHWVAKRWKQLSNWSELNWNAGESVEKRESSSTVGGNVNWYSHYGEQMVGWHHRLDEHKFEQVPEDSKGQGSLAFCSPGGCKDQTLLTE